jgi:hypothetical protein
MGIEPTSEAWEASILPLYDARSPSDCTQELIFRTAARVILQPGPAESAGLLSESGHQKRRRKIAFC